MMKHANSHLLSWTTEVLLTFYSIFSLCIKIKVEVGISFNYSSVKLRGTSENVETG